MLYFLIEWYKFERDFSSSSQVSLFLANETIFIGSNIHACYVYLQEMKFPTSLHSQIVELTS